MSDRRIPSGWSPEAWQRQMKTNIAVAYRLSEMGYLNIGDEPYDKKFADEIDADFNHWLEQHDAEVAKATEERIIKLLHDRFDWLLNQNTFEQTAEAEIWLRAIKLVRGEK
jgi:hypothetical protein